MNGEMLREKWASWIVNKRKAKISLTEELTKQIKKSGPEASADKSAVDLHH